jgi:hypothetical protein
MALRDKLRERVQPFLDEGEQVQAVIPAQTGMNPMSILLVGALIATLVNKYWLLVATDRRWIVLKQSKMSFKPKALDRSLDRSTPIGPLSGLWGKSTIVGGEKTYVHKRFHKDAAEADALAMGQVVGYGYVAPVSAAEPVAAATATTPAGWYPAPDGNGQRYWDGAAWTDHTAP